MTLTLYLMSGTGLSAVIGQQQLDAFALWAGAA